MRLLYEYNKTGKEGLLLHVQPDLRTSKDENDRVHLERCRVLTVKAKEVDTQISSSVSWGF